MENEKLWYVVNTYSGHENKVKEKIEAKTESMGMQDYISDLLVKVLNQLHYFLKK